MNPPPPTGLVEIAVDALASHPLNSNAMKPVMLDTLTAHIGRSDRYPPIIVRPLPHDAPRTAPHTHQVLDGHHRVAALRRLGRATARCVVWEVGDDEAKLLLATLNRLEGSDDPRKRGRLLAELGASIDGSALAAWLPESASQVDALAALATRPPPAPSPPRPLGEMPVAVHFFLLPTQRDALEARLAAIDDDRETALMRLVASNL